MTGLKNALRFALVLIGLAVLIIAPPLLTGFRDRQRAEAAMGSGDYAAAAAAYRSAAQRLPWQPALWEQAGEAAFLAGDPQTAILDLTDARAGAALSPWGWTYLGMSYQQAGDTASAVAAWRRALPLAEAYGFLAQAERKAGNFPAAMADWRASIARESDSAAAHYQLGLLLAATDPGEALPELMKSAALNPYLDTFVQGLRTSLNTALLSTDRAYQLVVSGRALAALGEWDLAAEAFRGATGLRPGYADAWAWLGEAQQHLGQDGTPELEKAVALDPVSAMVQSLYGIYWQRRGQPGQALAAYRMAADLEPQNAAWLAALGSAYEQGGDLIAALDYYNRAVQLAPGDTSAWRALAEFSLRNSVDLTGTGLPAAQRLVDLDQDDWQALDLCGQITLGTGDTAKAEQLLKQALEMAPRQPAPVLHLALVYLTRGDGISAYAFLKKAAALDPEGPYGEQARRLLEQYFSAAP